MADLPKFVRERFATAPAGAHPDADQLTGFAEKRLGERERAQVLAHLSACQACREVVSLALPEKEDEAAAAPQSAPWWGLRWQTAAAMAAVAVAAVALLTIPNSFFRSGRSATTQVAQAPAGKTAATREEYGRAQAVPPESAVADGTPAAKTASGPAPVAGKRGAGAGGGAAGAVSTELAKAEQEREDKDKLAMARSMPSPPQKKEDQVHALAPPPPAPGGQPVEAGQANKYDFKGVQAAPAAADQATAQAGAEKQQYAVGGAIATPAPAQNQRSVVESRKAPVTAPPAQAATDRAPQTSETVEVSAAAVQVEAGPQWRTTTAGRLQRSRDAGQSWRTVTVAAGTVLNAVSAVGDLVWAGGHQQRAAVLYYSADNGAHWARLDFTAPAGAQAADVVALNFTDAQHGVMTVVAAADPRLRQIWTTADGGRTWTAPPGR
ncbi:MAG TPA: zf-HC2 domain-containing protein [Terriglobales bacterium]|nr:zf-HC2 domain-containing protein [Terriglobales bacterium]